MMLCEVVSVGDLDFGKLVAQGFYALCHRCKVHVTSIRHKSSKGELSGMGFMLRVVLKAGTDRRLRMRCMPESPADLPFFCAATAQQPSLPLRVRLVRQASGGATVFRSWCSFRMPLPEYDFRQSRSRSGSPLPGNHRQDQC